MQLSLQNISKTYNKKIVIKSINTIVNEGIYGILGSNGAGKSTLMRMICGLEYPDQGNILYNGIDINNLKDSYKNILGYLPQNVGFYNDFSAYDYLVYISLLKNVPKNNTAKKVDELIELVGLTEVKNTKIKKFSGGMKQRLGIAQALVNDPKILVLDEPTAGLDPKERIYFRNLISSFSKEKIVLVSTHIVSDIENIADEILIIESGELKLQGNLEKVLKYAKGKVWDCIVDSDAANILRKKYNIANLKRENDKYLLRIVSEEKPCNDAVQIDANLEDVFLNFFCMR